MEPNHPWPFEEVIEIQDLAGTEMSNLDFVGIKIGDVNNTAKANALQILPRDGRKVLNVNAIAEGDIIEGELLEIRFVVPEQVSGFQWTLEATGLEYVSVKSKDIPIDDSNIGLLGDGRITMSWNGELVHKESGIISFVIIP